MILYVGIVNLSKSLDGSVGCVMQC